jgi:hypothetical protein
MTYTIAVAPSATAGKVTATSSDGYTLTTSTPLLDGARHWQNQGADPNAAITTPLVKRHSTLRAALNHQARRGDRFQKAIRDSIDPPARQCPALTSGKYGAF